MIYASVIFLCEWATQDATRKLNAGNTFDEVVANVPPNIQVPAEAKMQVPALHLVFFLVASIADGTDHKVRLEVVHEDGQLAVDPIELPMQFILNKRGRPMKFQGIVNMSGLPLPARTADYSIKLFVDGELKAETPLYVTVTRNPEQ